MLRTALQLVHLDRVDLPVGVDEVARVAGHVVLA
jgi:hypothetical protein